MSLPGGAAIRAWPCGAGATDFQTSTAPWPIFKGGVEKLNSAEKIRRTSTGSPTTLPSVVSSPSGRRDTSASPSRPRFPGQSGQLRQVRDDLLPITPALQFQLHDSLFSFEFPQVRIIRG